MNLRKYHSIVDKIMAYEEGQLDEGEVVDFFQELVDLNILNSLQGSYQRHAEILINQGYIEVAAGE